MSEYVESYCPRNHADLKYRNPDLALDDLPLGMYNAYMDAKERGCGHDKAVQYKRMEVKMETETNPTISEAAATALEPGLTIKVKKVQKPKSCKLCGKANANTRTHGRPGHPGQDVSIEPVETTSA